MSGCFLALLAVLVATEVTGQGVRLNDELSPYEGIVEVYVHNVSAWVRICNEIRFWSMTEADIACRQLGHNEGAMWDSALTNETEWSGKWMSQIICKGDEVTLLGCSYEISDACLVQNSAAGVSCNFAGYRGCYVDNIKDRALSGKAFISVSNMTIEKCLKLCRDESFAFAGVESGDDCYCDNEDSNFWKHGRADNEKCDTECQGDENQSCGSLLLPAPPHVGVYEANMGACGGLINDDVGTVYSPNFPGVYLASADCDWLISGPDNSSISSEISMFELRNENDYIEFRDGETSDSPLLGRYTKSDGVTEIPDTSSNKLLIIFVAYDGGDETRGFFSVDFKTLSWCFYNNSGMDEPANQTMVKPGAVLIVKCINGYDITTNYTNVTCLGDGLWDNEVPQCRKDDDHHENPHKFGARVLIVVVLLAILALIILILYQRLSKKKHREDRNLYIDDAQRQQQQSDLCLGHGRESNKYRSVGDGGIQDDAELFWDDYASVDQSKSINAVAANKGDHYTPMHPGQGDLAPVNKVNLHVGANTFKDEDEWFEENPLRGPDPQRPKKSTVTSDDSRYATVGDPGMEFADNVFYDKGGDEASGNMPSEKQKLYENDDVANPAPSIWKHTTDVGYEPMNTRPGSDVNEHLYDSADPNSPHYKPLTEREKSSFYSLTGVEDKQSDSEHDPIY